MLNVDFCVCLNGSILNVVNLYIYIQIQMKRCFDLNVVQVYHLNSEYNWTILFLLYMKNCKDVRIGYTDFGMAFFF